MSFEGPINKKGTGNLYNKETTSDNVFALIASAVVVSGTDKFSLGKVYKLLDKEGAEDIGITESYDQTNKVLLHYHISEFFRINPDGILFLYGVAQTVKLKDMAKDHIIPVVKSEVASRSIRGVGLVCNPKYPYTPTMENGMNKDVLEAVSLAQTSVNTLFGESIYIDNVLVEGRDMETNLTTVKDLRELKVPQVSVTVLQDPEIAAKETEYKNTAAVGTVLGSIGVRKVSESAGSVVLENYPQQYQGRQDFPIDGDTRFDSVALSNGTIATSLTLKEQQLLTQKGYIYGGSFEGYAGVFLNDSPTCIDLNNNFSYIENTRVWNKAARFVREVLIPKIRGKVPYDGDGNIEPLLVQNWKNLVERRLRLMITAEDITDATFTIVSSGKNKPLTTKLRVTLYGIAREIENELILN